MKKSVQIPLLGASVQLLTINEVAARLHVHRATVYDFINQPNGLPVTRLAAKVVRIDEADLRAWIEQRKAVS